jgi:glycosyltransferase involved in cell wall biosynthesis
MKGFSIIICTHNPNEEIFNRLLVAIDHLEVDGILFEIIIVDNNSDIPLSTNKFVKDFLGDHSNVTLILENKPGLTSARIAGIEKSKFDWVVFFDDDNEPKSNYLQNALLAISKYPQVGAWGPGEIDVEFMERVPIWLEKEKWLFQARNEKKTIFADLKSWQDFYPFGTGLVIRNEIAQIYTHRVSENRYTLSDRKGKSLASGGDVQLVLTGIEQGYCAGVIGELKISHLIDLSKTTLIYLQKQQYSTASAYVKAFNQVFVQSPIALQTITNKKVLFTVYSLFRNNRKKLGRERFRLLVASKMGELNAQLEAADANKPFLLKLFQQIIHV